MLDREYSTRILLAINLVSFSVIIMLLLAGFGGKTKSKFTEIDAERINIMGTNGRPVLVLSNRRLMPGPSFNGKEYPPSVSEGRDLLSGMLFFNEQGDEVGGLLYNGFKKGAGPNDYSAIEHFSLDQWKQNQVITLQYNDHGNTRRAGLGIWDRPVNTPMGDELDRILRLQKATTDAERDAIKREFQEAQTRGDGGAQRLFVGSRDRTAEVLLSDTKGRAKARLYVGPDGAPHLDFLDDAGTVIASYPK